MSLQLPQACCTRRYVTIYLQPRVHGVDAASDNHFDIDIFIQTILATLSTHAGMLDSSESVQNMSVHQNMIAG